MNKNYCIDCGKEISLDAKRCRSCARKGKNNPFYGKHHTEETTKEMSETRRGRESSLKGKKLSEEHKKKLSENHADLSGENHPFFGKHHSEETKEKIRAKNKGHIITDEQIKKLSKSLRLKDDNFDSTHEFFNDRAYFLHRGRWERTNHPHVPLSWDVFNFFNPHNSIIKDDGYVIHHINENPLDNDIENLVKMTLGDHTILHKSKI